MSLLVNHRLPRTVVAIQDLSKEIKDVRRRATDIIKGVVKLIIDTKSEGILNEDSYLMLGDHGFDMIMVIRKDEQDQVFIEGFTAEGNPVFSEVWEYMTNTWDDCELDTLIEVLVALELLHKNLTSGE